MFELPLFPLNSVLFPGTPLQLHIFEERYKKLVNLCVQEDKPFGVVLIKEGREALGPLAEPVAIGCSAQIMHVQELEDGRLNILTLGKERFRILSLDRDTNPYLVGAVEQYPIMVDLPELLEERGRVLQVKVERFIQALVEAGNVEFDMEQLPDNPIRLAYMAAAMVQIPLPQKQALLATERAEDLVGNLEEIYRRETAMLKIVLSKRNDVDLPFSRN